MKQKPALCLVKCETYDNKQVLDRMRALLKPLGGIKAFVKPGQQVALKINLLMGAAPEKCICTHPAIIRAVASLVREAGGKPFIADSPGAAIPYKTSSLNRTYQKSGLANLGVPLNTDTGYDHVSLPKNRIIKRVEVIKPLLNADVVINLPKVKTHSFMFLTCAVKNMFGMVPGFLKVGYHSKLKSPERFGAMLLDVLETRYPEITIIDGIRGMEGEGPSGGNPKDLGVMIAGKNPIAADYLVCRIIGFAPERIPYLSIAQKEGICPHDLSEIELFADEDIGAFETRFKPPATMIGASSGGFYQTLLKIFTPLLNYTFTLRPVVNSEKCVGCGACVKACPEGIIELKTNSRGKNTALIHPKNCIRCYCCHEMCPHKAIDLHKSLLYRMFIGN